MGTESLSLSHWDEDAGSIKVTENVPDGVDVYPEVMMFRVGKVFSLGGKEGLGIWVHHWDENGLYGPILIDFETWEAIDKHIRKTWRDRTWVVYTFFERIAKWFLRLDIRLL